MRGGAWQTTIGVGLHGRVLGVIGLGRLGSEVAKIGKAFGMQVVAWSEHLTTERAAALDVERVDKKDLLQRADIVTIHLVLSPRTTGIIGAAEFDLMKSKSYFIAVSRGGIYDMGGLVKALDSNRLAGAGVDVTDPEPLPKGHPLWKFNNVVITPHIAGRSDRDHDRMVGTLKENIQRFVDGRPLVNVVDKQKGY